MSQNNSIFLIGAPGVGKSSIAHKLIHTPYFSHNSFQFLGTDSIREVMRATGDKKQTPILYTSAILANQYATSSNPSPVWGYVEQAKIVSSGINALIKRSIKENILLLLEGIHLLPQYIESKYKQNYTLFVITAPNETQHKNQIKNQQETRSSYKLKNFSKAKAYQQYLIQLATNEKLPVIENNTIDSSVTQILHHI